MRIVHVITTVDRGGAEIQLLRVVAGLPTGAYDTTVVALSGRNTLQHEFEQTGVRLVRFDMAPGSTDLRAVARLRHLLRELQPDVVQTWLYAGDLVGSLAARLAGCRQLVWTLQSGNRDPGAMSRATRVARWLLRFLARLMPRRVICSSRDVMRFHIGQGYPEAKMVFVSNGADCAGYRPDAAARAAIRAELGLADGTPLIGMVARFNPQKDYATMVAAAGLLHRRRPGVHCVLVGYGVDPANPELAEWIARAGLSSNCHLLGLRSDIAAIDAALDIGCLSSAYGETFPLAISETMACGVPCVVTDVGDLAFMVGDTGRVVPCRDPAAMAAALDELLALPAAERAALGRRARERVQTAFSIDATIAGYRRVWDEVALAGAGA